MVVVFPPDVRARLDAIETEEGVPAVEVVHQAIDVWSQLDADERKILGLTAMSLVLGRVRRQS